MINEAATSDRPGGSLLTRWEPRIKLAGLFALIFSFAFVQNIYLLPFMILITITVYTLSGLPPGFLFSRLRLPGFFLLAVAVILPFWSGPTVLWQFGPLALRLEGLMLLLLIATRFVCILTVAIALFGTTSLWELTLTLRSWGIPWLLTDLLLFTYRYLYQLGDDFQRMRTAARLRGFAGDSYSALKPFAFMTGTMLVRSHEQAERVFQAMTLRGYGNGTCPLPDFRPALTDYLLLAMALICATALIGAQVML